MKEEYLLIRNLSAGEEGAALDHLSLRVSRGDFVEILGTEGAGKTVLSEFFSGHIPIREGSVQIGGRRYLPGERLSGMEVQCIRRTTSLAESLTVAENISLLTRNRRIRGVIRHKDLEVRANFLLSEFGLGFRADVPVYSLSEGEKRAVELLRAVENEIPFLFIADIFESVGQADLQLLENVLRQMKQRGFAVLITGGGFPLFRDLDDRVIVLRSGRNVRTFYRESFDREEYVKWVFGGAEEPSRARSDTVFAMNDGEVRTQKSGSPPVLTLEEVSTDVVKDVSLTVYTGEIAGFYDMNHVNNRELVRLLTGETKASAGKIFLEGKPYHPSGIREAVSKGVCYIPAGIRECAAVESMSYGENLILPVMRKLSRRGFLVNSRIRRFLEEEYGEELSVPVKSLKTAGELGMADRLRLALQRAILLRPALLLVEDTVSDMNVRMLRLQSEYFERLTRAGCSVIVSSQNVTVLRRLCDRIIVLNE